MPREAQTVRKVSPKARTQRNLAASAIANVLVACLAATSTRMGRSVEDDDPQTCTSSSTDKSIELLGWNMYGCVLAICPVSEIAGLLDSLFLGDGAPSLSTLCCFFPGGALTAAAAGAFALHVLHTPPPLPFFNSLLEKSAFVRAHEHAPQGHAVPACAARSSARPISAFLTRGRAFTVATDNRQTDDETTQPQLFGALTCHQIRCLAAGAAYVCPQCRSATVHWLACIPVGMPVRHCH